MVHRRQPIILGEVVYPRCIYFLFLFIATMRGTPPYFFSFRCNEEEFPHLVVLSLIFGLAKEDLFVVLVPLNFDPTIRTYFRLGHVDGLAFDIYKSQLVNIHYSFLLRPGVFYAGAGKQKSSVESKDDSPLISMTLYLFFKFFFFIF